MLSSFISQNRLTFIIILALITAALIGIGIYSAVHQKRIENSAMAADEIQSLYEDWQAAAEDEKADLPEVKKGYDPRKVKIDVAVNAMLPTEYMSDSTERVEFYRRLSRAETQQEIEEMREELIDRFGPLPEEAAHLLDIVETQALSARGAVARVDLYEDSVFLEFAEEWGGENMQEYLAKLVELTEDMPVELKGTGSLGLKLSFQDEQDWFDRWKSLKSLLSNLPEMSQM